MEPVISTHHYNMSSSECIYQMCSRGRGHYEVVCHSVNTVRVVEEDTFLGNMEAEIAVMK